MPRELSRAPIPQAPDLPCCSEVKVSQPTENKGQMEKGPISENHPLSTAQNGC